MARHVVSVLFGGALLLAACGGGETTTDGPEGPAAINVPESEGTAETDDSEGSEQFESDRGRLGSEIADSETDPQAFRGEVGKQINYDCPAGGTASSIWGVEVYTDDSSVCTAAVHVGLLTFEDGGTVLVEITAGQDSYQSGVANEIESRSYSTWGGSFIFPMAPPGSGTFGESTESWGETAKNAELGDVIEVDCVGGGTVSGLWGTGSYTTDSSICTAGVHAGIITQEEGGKVTATVVEGAEGPDGYVGSEANGVKSSSWASYPLSFTVS